VGRRDIYEGRGGEAGSVVDWNDGVGVGWKGGMGGWEGMFFILRISGS